jgi:hypothetical protein
MLTIRESKMNECIIRECDVLHGYARALASISERMVTDGCHMSCMDEMVQMASKLLSISRQLSRTGLKVSDQMFVDIFED